MKNYLIFFFVSLTTLCKAQAPGNNTLLNNYFAPVYSKYTLYNNSFTWSTDLSKNLVLESYSFLHKAQTIALPINPPAFTRANTALLTLIDANSGKRYICAALSTPGEMHIETGYAGYSKDFGKNSFYTSFQASAYSMQNENTKKGSNFLSMPRRFDLNSNLMLRWLRSGNEWTSRLVLEADFLHSKSYLGEKRGGEKTIPAYNALDANELFSTRQNRNSKVLKTVWSFNENNYHNFISVNAWLKQYTDSTRVGNHTYAAKQNTATLLANWEKKIRHFNLNGGLTFLYDKAEENISETKITRDLKIPGFFSSAEFSMLRWWKISGNYQGDFHPVFGYVQQGGLRTDWNFKNRLGYAGAFWSRGARTVNVLQENFQLISGNRSLIVPVNLLQETVNRFGAMADYRFSEDFNVKFLYQYNYFGSFVFADAGEDATRLTFSSLKNSFSKHVFESSASVNFDEKFYINFKMRNNIFKLITERGKTSLFYTPASDMHLELLWTLFSNNKVRKGKEYIRSLNFVLSNYYAIGMKVLSTRYNQSVWKKKNFYQMDAEIVYKIKGEYHYNEKKRKRYTLPTCEFKLNFVNIFYTNPETFIQSGAQNSFSGTQIWGNNSPPRICGAVAYYFRR